MEHTFIGDLIRGKAHVRVIVTNGYQMTGRILDHSDRAILIREDGGVEKMVYKHAISTIEKTTR